MPVPREGTCPIERLWGNQPTPLAPILFLWSYQAQKSNLAPCTHDVNWTVSGCGSGAQISNVCSGHPAIPRDLTTVMLLTYMLLTNTVHRVPPAVSLRTKQGRGGYQGPRSRAVTSFNGARIGCSLGGALPHMMMDG